MAFINSPKKNNGTRLYMVSNLSVKRLFKIIEPVIRIMSQKNAQKQFDNLKELLELGGR